MPNRRITPRDRRRFTQGDCLILAEEISAITGYPVYCLRDDSGCHAFHAFVLTPGRKALDVTGVTPVKEMVEEWDAAGYKKGSWKGFSEQYPGSRRRARLIAPLLAAQVA